jgi:hypothetical protein
MARAQPAALPAIGFLGVVSPDLISDRLPAFRPGLKDNGPVEGENVAIVYRWSEGEPNWLPESAAELARRPVAVIVAVANAPWRPRQRPQRCPSSSSPPRIRSGSGLSRASRGRAETRKRAAKVENPKQPEND